MKQDMCHIVVLLNTWGMSHLALVWPALVPTTKPLNMLLCPTLDWPAHTAKMPCSWKQVLPASRYLTIFFSTGCLYMPICMFSKLTTVAATWDAFLTAPPVRSWAAALPSQSSVPQHPLMMAMAWSAGTCSALCKSSSARVAMNEATCLASQYKPGQVHNIKNSPVCTAGP